MRGDRAPKRSFGCDADGVWLHVVSGDAERFQMRRPRRPIDEAFVHVACEQIDDLQRQSAPTHVGDRSVIDQMRAVARIQQFEKVQPALGTGGRE